MKKISITEQPFDTWKISMVDGDNVFPHEVHKTAKKLVARLAQLLGIKENIKPQDFPEEFCIGEFNN